MGDPNQALATQLRNIETRTGQTLAALCAVVRDSGLAKHGEVRSMLMQRYGLGYGDANTLAHHAAGPAPSQAADDPLDAIYAGAKAGLRPLHEQLIAAIEGLGAFETAPKKAYVSLRRKKQFAMLGPATREQLELGLNAKGLPADPRLKALAAGGMCNYSLRLSTAADIDAQLLGWVRSAYDAAA